MPRSAVLTLLAAAVAATALSCASSPPVSPAKPPAVKARTIELVCHEAARFARFDQLGVPEGETPIDLDLTPDHVWVLFEGRLLKIDRHGSPLGLQILVPRTGERWAALDADPVDGSVWVVAANSLELFNVSSEGRARRVALQRKVQGEGGFGGVLVARDAIYVNPFCASAAVWRLDRSGRLLGTAFPAPEGEEGGPDRSEVVNLEDPDPGCYGVHLERGADGRILAWDHRQKSTLQVDEEGVWTPSDTPLFQELLGPLPAASVKGVDVGERSEQWYFAGYRRLFYWKGHPVLLGNHTVKERSLGNDTVLHLPELREDVLMTCRGAPISNVGTDAAGYVAVSWDFLVFGEFATAPDLPAAKG